MGSFISRGKVAGVAAAFALTGGALAIPSTAAAWPEACNAYYNSSFNSGYTAGSDEGYNRGFYDGYVAGYPQGQAAESASENEFGPVKVHHRRNAGAQPPACHSAIVAGYSQGYRAGYSASYNTGFQRGFDSGYEDGFDAG